MRILKTQAEANGATYVSVEESFEYNATDIITESSRCASNDGRISYNGKCIFFTVQQGNYK